MVADVLISWQAHFVFVFFVNSDDDLHEILKGWKRSFFEVITVAFGFGA